MRLRAFLAGLLLAGQAHAQIVVRHPAFAVVQSTAPALDLNFLTTTLDSRVTFSRASTRSCTNSSGQIVSVAVNVACMDYDPGTLALKGLSVEAAGTNLLYYSQDFSNAVWTTNAATTKTAAYATAPDGTTTAARVQLVSSGNQAVTWFQQNLAGAGVGASLPNTVSLWVKSTSGANQTFAIKSTQSGVADHFSSDLVATSTWQRFSFSTTFAAGGAGYFAGVTVGSALASADIEVWGLQLETGYATTSYIPTTSAAVTRAADVAYVNVVGLQGINGNTGSLFGQMVYEAPVVTATSAAARWLSFNDGNNPNAGTEFGFEGGSIVDGLIDNQATRTVMSNVVASTMPGTTYRLAIAFSPINAAEAGNSTAYPTATRAAGSTPLSLTVLNLNQSQRFQGQASIWFQRVTYYPAYLGPAWVTNKANGAIP